MISMNYLELLCITTNSYELLGISEVLRTRTSEQPAASASLSRQIRSSHDAYESTWCQALSIGQALGDFMKGANFGSRFAFQWKVPGVPRGL